ncbi:subtilisin-like protein [Xylaria curta]|nr:subtilisin-like protein [Xylaria curta]
MSVRTSRVRTPVPHDSVQFAIESIDKVVEIGKIITNSDRNAALFCNALRGVLWSIKSHLQKPHQVHKVESFLNNLERLCSWPRSIRKGATNKWPTLNALKFPSNLNNAANCLRNLAIDVNQVQARTDIIEKLTKFSAKSLKDEIAEVTQTSAKWVSRGSPHVSHELDDDIELLYNALMQYRTCKTEGSHRDIIINIRLNGYRTILENGAPARFIVDNASAEFGVLFLDHPHARGGYWQEACIQTCHPRSSKIPTIIFTDDESQLLTPHLSPAQTPHKLIPCESFCQHISCRSQDLLCLSTRDGEFIYHKRSNASRQWLASQEAVPLASIFTSPELNLYDKSKAILEMLVARATWQFYDSDAIGQGLTSHNIHFICEQRLGVNGIFINEPVLLTRFPKNKTGTQDDGDILTAEMIHDLPKILSLGILLLELETRKTMEKHRENPKICPPGPFNINTNYKIASNLVATGPNAHPESIISDIDPRSPLRTILPLCIKSGELKIKLQQSLSARKSVPSRINVHNALRSIIYSEIVYPLETWANQYDDLNRVKPLYEVADTPAMPRLAPPLAPTPQPTSSVNRRDPEYLCEASRKWFAEYEKLRSVLQPIEPEKGSDYEPIKIAILDTGIKQEEYNYYLECQVHMEYADFINATPKSTTSDDTGHGTAGISLLVKTCPSASFYIVRVLKGNTATLADVDTMVKGIDWAIQKQVDIITMAIGFEHKQMPIVDAVDRAHRKGIHIFSAASNSGNLGSIYCPAILTEQVFGIFSTDAVIRESRSLNPSPLDPDSFAIFGENVQLYTEEGPLVRGTSYSTSIAAGLAGTLLDFAKRETNRDGSSELSELKKRQQLKRVFREMSRPDGRYHCIRPWKLLNHDYMHEGSKQREWIRGTIKRLLQPEKLHE